MIGFNHALSGALVAVAIPAQYSGLVPVAAFLLHFVLDALPHYGKDDTAPVGSKKFHRILVVDALLCLGVLALALYLYPSRAIIILVGMFFAVLPDFLWIFNHYIKVRSKIAAKFFRFASWIQWGERPWAWSLEILYAMIQILLLFMLY